MLPFTLFLLLPFLPLTSPLPPYSTPTLLLLQQTISFYPLSIDSKNFTLLSQIFAKHVIANYSAPIGVLTGLEAVQIALERSLSPVMTQHLFGGFYVRELDEREGRGESVQYYTASHFGMGEKEGQVLYAYGQYVDNWVVEDGCWRIGRRQLNYMGPFIGNLSVFS